MSKYLFFFILFFTFTFDLFSQKIPLNNKTFSVVLDPGHGGYDTGTKTYNNIFEKEINLYVAKYIELYLNQFAPEINVILTRDKDEFISLKKRPLYAKLSNANLFISIHCNEFQKSYAKGLEIYIQKSSYLDDDIHYKKAHIYGFLLEEIIEKKLHYKSNGIKYENFSVLRNSIKFVPSVLIEIGYFSNSKDANYITSKKGIDGVALAIAKSIIDYSKLNI